MKNLRRLCLAALSVVLTASMAHAQDTEAQLASNVAEIEACLASSPDDEQSCRGQQSDRCMETEEGQSTLGMNDCFRNETAAWDEILNRRYAKAVAAAKERDRDLAESFEPDVFASLQTAQRAWITFRDAECDRIYAYSKDGTIKTTEWASCHLRLTSTRAIDLAPDET